MSTPRTPGKRVAPRAPSRRAVRRSGGHPDAPTPREQPQRPAEKAPVSPAPAPAPAPVSEPVSEPAATPPPPRASGKYEPRRAAKREPRRETRRDTRDQPPRGAARDDRRPAATPPAPPVTNEPAVTEAAAASTVEPPAREKRLAPRVLARKADATERGTTPSRAARWLWVVGTLAVVAGVAGVVSAIVEVGPAWLDQVSAILLSTTLTFALAARTGGRPYIFGGLALAFGAVAVGTGNESLRGGAALLTAVSAGVLGVMATVPAVKFRDSVREVLVALFLSSLGALAVIGFRPVVSLERFDYLTLTLAFLLAIGLVYRLGAGLHGLGRRGLVIVLAGFVSLAVTLVYAELLRRYGSQGMVDSIYDGVRWFRSHAGAVPRPIHVLVGVPALVWGTHMRARRRQGWWVCAFGTAVTVSVAGILVNPYTGWLEACLIVLYSLLPGLLVGYVLIRLDLALTGPRGRRARRQEELSALRPEPARWQPLL